MPCEVTLTLWFLQGFDSYRHHTSQALVHFFWKPSLIELTAVLRMTLKKLVLEYCLPDGKT